MPPRIMHPRADPGRCGSQVTTCALRSTARRAEHDPTAMETPMPRSTKTPRTRPALTRSGAEHCDRGGLLGGRDGLARLRRLAGNRSAIRALDGPRLGGRSAVGGPVIGGPGLKVLSPTGRPEHEADRAADRALAHRPGRGSPGGGESGSGPGIPKLSAGMASRGHRVSADFSSRISARSGGGRPLMGHVRRSVEPGFGVDFGRVRIHTDRAAGTMARSIGADAFTVGRDVYFAPGKFAPESRSGRQRLAHELSHTVQQSGLARGLGGQGRPGLGTASAVAIQGLISKALFLELCKGHDPADLEEEGKGESRYHKILESLEGYHTARESDDGSKGSRKAREAHLRKLIDRCRKFTDWYGYGEGIPTAVWELMDDAEFEAGHRWERSSVMAGLERKDRLEKAALSDKLRYGVRVYAWIGDPLYAKFAKERSKLITRKKLNPFNTTDSKEIRTTAATTIIDSYRSELKDEARTKAIEALEGSACGHTWVGLERHYKETGERADQLTYGFWPSERVHPTQAVKGMVRHPDSVHAGDSPLRTRYTEVSQSNYVKAMQEAERWRSAPPTYKMVERNCTTFGRDVARKAGVDFPDSYWTVPIVGGDIWNPNDLFDAFEETKV